MEEFAKVDGDGAETVGNPVKSTLATAGCRQLALASLLAQLQTKGTFPAAQVPAYPIWVMCSWKTPDIQSQSDTRSARRSVERKRSYGARLTRSKGQLFLACLPFGFGVALASLALRPRPICLASCERAAAYAGATIGYAGSSDHFSLYCSGVRP